MYGIFKDHQTAVTYPITALLGLLSRLDTTTTTTTNTITITTIVRGYHRARRPIGAIASSSCGVDPPLIQENEKYNVVAQTCQPMQDRHGYDQSVEIIDKRVQRTVH